MKHVTRLFCVVSAVVVLPAISWTAWAYWSVGAGTASATVGSLTAPTSVLGTATPGSSNVAVTWTGVTAPNGGAVSGYYVVRLSGAVASPACASSPSALLPASPASCSDLGVSDGTYTYRVTAVFSSWTATSASSALVTVNTALHLTVTAPASATAGASFSVTVVAKDTSNATVTGYRGTVAFTSSDPGSPTLPASYTFTAGDNGSHTFTNGVSLRTAPSQTITATDTVLSTILGSTSVTVTPGTAAKLAVTQQTTGGTGGVAWTTQPKVAVQDAFGNTVTSSAASVTLAITAGTGTAGAALTCTTNPSTATSGIATFAGCRIDKAGTGYTLTATATGLTAAIGTSFNLTVGPAARLAFTTQPSGGASGTPWSTQPRVTIQDAGGNTVTTSSATVTLAITPPVANGTNLTCTTNPLAASSGVATFAGCKINKPGTGFTLTATATGLTSAISAAFNLT